MSQDVIKRAIRVLYNFTDTSKGVTEEEVLRVFGISKDLNPEEIMGLLVENKYLNPSGEVGVYKISEDGLKLIKAI